MVFTDASNIDKNLVQSQRIQIHQPHDIFSGIAQLMEPALTTEFIYLQIRKIIFSALSHIGLIGNGDHGCVNISNQRGICQFLAIAGKTQVWRTPQHMPGWQRRCGE